jgi:predicted N-formylglutamate amidohydrolase
VSEIPEDAVEIVQGSSSASPVLFTCEHASQRLPEPWQWTAEDRWLIGTHWAYDLGAADLTRELARELGAVAVLSRFSRLLADPNRPEGDRDLFRRTAEGRFIAMNRSIDAREELRRLTLWRAYHDVVDREVLRSSAPVVFAVHTFTPVYEGRARQLEAGVLFDEEEALAERLRAAVAAAGFRVALNEPYSGKLGLMYSVARHARTHGRRAIELELRQDLAVAPQARARLIASVAALLGGL